MVKDFAYIGVACLRTGEDFPNVLHIALFIVFFAWMCLLWSCDFEKQAENVIIIDQRPVITKDLFT